MTSLPRNRSLADDLRRRDEADLAFLLLHRADLTLPTPDSITDVAARAATNASVRMALHQLDRSSLAVVWAVAATGSTDPAVLAAHLADPGESVDTWQQMASKGLVQLHRLGLVWRDGDAFRPVRALAEVVAAVVTDPRPLPAAAPPAETGREYAADVVDRFAGQQGLAAVQTMREVLRRLESEPLGLTRDTTLAVRELTSFAGLLGLSESTTAMWLELGWYAGLLGPAADASEVLPTMAGEVWRTAPAPEAWALLAQTWWSADRDWGAFDRANGTRPYVFGDTHLVSQVPVLRTEWAELSAEVGCAPVRNASALLLDRRPLADPDRVTELAATIAREAELLGVSGRGVLSAMGRALLVDSPITDPQDPVPAARLVAVAAPMLPEEIEAVVVQGDLTIVAPGPLTPQVAAQVGAFAALESTGAAAVYRLSVSSLEEALDRGWDAESILDVLRERSQVPIPQPVEYLIHDTAARHGRIRVGAARGYVRTEDSAAMDLVMAALTKAGVPVNRLTATVAVSARSSAALLGAIRSAGVAATAQDADGLSETIAAPRVAPVPRPPVPVTGVDPARVKALAGALTAVAVPTDDIDLPPAPAVPRMHSAQVQAVLTGALSSNGRVWLRYADNAGVDGLYLIKPLHVGGGVCEAFDVSRARPRRFAISRIVGVVAA